MGKTFTTELIYQIAALLLSIIIVHALYVAWIRPEARAFIAEEIAAIQADENHIPQRSFYVIVRDLEQETCFILFLWALAIIGYKTGAIVRERRLLGTDLVPRAEGTRILPEDVRAYSRRIQELDRGDRLLPRALLAALHRFAATRNVQDVSDTARGICASESDRLETELSMVRYIAWAIPSIGFIGTVRGIGEALGQAHKAVAGDITGVTQSLGVAFNSTFIALLISIVVMFLLHQLQQQQERLVMDTETYLDRKLIEHMQQA